MLVPWKNTLVPFKEFFQRIAHLGLPFYNQAATQPRGRVLLALSSHCHCVRTERSMVSHRSFSHTAGRETRFRGTWPNYVTKQPEHKLDAKRRGIILCKTRNTRGKLVAETLILLGQGGINIHQNRPPCKGWQTTCGPLIMFQQPRMSHHPPPSNDVCLVAASPLCSNRSKSSGERSHSSSQDRSPTWPTVPSYFSFSQRKVAQQR